MAGRSGYVNFYQFPKTFPFFCDAKKPIWKVGGMKEPQGQSP